LRLRGLVVGQGRRGSAISHHPPIAQGRASAILPAHALDLASGNPDPALLPRLGAALAGIDTAPVLYGGELCDPNLMRIARRAFASDGIPAESLTVVSGALDGIERALAAWLRPGDRVAVEDPGFASVFHLLSALGLVPVPVEVDDSGPLPDAAERALRSGVQAFVITTRAQNPFGCALDERRVRELRALLRRHSEVLVRTLCTDAIERFAVVRSVSKALGPDLRLAILAGDAATVARVEGRLALGIRWVSHLLQRTVAALLSDKAVMRGLRDAERTYTERRRSLQAALAELGVQGFGRSGMNVWVPVADEDSAAAALLESGFAVATGARFRIRSAPALRITTATLEGKDAPRVAEAVALALRPARRSSSA
jgi:DNA-binding transcriptional MocR family regulator